MLMKKFGLIFTLLVIFSMHALAVPALRVWRNYVTADGSMVKAMLVGDEHLHYYLTEDNRPMQMVGDRLQPLNQSLTTLRREHNRRMAKANGLRRAARATGTFSGKHRALVILVAFADKAFKNSNAKAEYNNIMNQHGYSGYGAVGSVHDYFYDQSYGQFDLDFDVVGPVTVSRGYSYYGENDANNDDMHVTDMVREACQLAADSVDFSAYDWDGDGECELVYLIYAGYGEATGGAANTIWPHQYQLVVSGGTQRVGNVYVNTYACGNELITVQRGSGLHAREEDMLNGMGVFCHEFSHCLGLPDFYDTQYSGNYGMGVWSVMANGCYNGPLGKGWVPEGYTSYERAFCGWITPVELDREALTVTDLQPLQNADTKVYKLTNPGWSSNPNVNEEYFLFDNHKADGWYRYDEGEGLFVTHVDYNNDIWGWNMVNSTPENYLWFNDHERMAPLPARGNVQNAWAVPWPAGGRDSITATSSPGFTLYHANYDLSRVLHSKVLNIKVSDDGLVSFDYVPDPNRASTGIVNIRRNGDGNAEQIFDLQGRLVPANVKSLPAGLYIIRHGDGTTEKKLIR